MTELKVLTADEQVANILAADARRVRRLTWATVGLWGLTVSLTGLLAFGFYVLHERGARTASTYWSERRQPELDSHEADRHALVGLVMDNMAMAVQGFFQAVAVCLLSLSALGTVLLVHASRRATLRQIQASLAAIAGQLAEVQRGRGTIPPTAGG